MTSIKPLLPMLLALVVMMGGLVGCSRTSRQVPSALAARTASDQTGDQQDQAAKGSDPSKTKPSACIKWPADSVRQRKDVRKGVKPTAYAQPSSNRAKGL